MTSEERKNARFARRKMAREEKRLLKTASCNSFEHVFQFSNLYRAYKLCRRGVAWKSSTQSYISSAPLNVFQAYRQLQNGKFRSDGFVVFTIMERGKTRRIRSVSIRERVVQRCLCDNSLTPVLERTFIHDNGATLKQKGYSFTIRRLCEHLRKHYRKHGQEGYVLLFDFSKFFDNVSHRLLEAILHREFSDSRLLKLIQQLIDAFGERGLGLGSQISQVLALASANRLDHYIKEVLRIKGYGRYMDDGYLIHPSKAYLQKCREHICELCEVLGIKLNRKKTQIVKLSHGFIFLKVRFYLTKSGKVVRKLCRQSIVRARRRLKALKRMVEEGVLTVDDAYASFQSWRSYASHFNAHNTIRNMESLYNRLFQYERR